MTNGERLRHLRKELLGLTLDKFGDRIGLKKSALSSLENDNSSLTDQTIKSICREFHTSEVWIRTGEGDPFEPDPQDELDALARKFNLTPRMRILIGKLAAMGENEQNSMLNFMEEVVNDARAEEAETEKISPEEKRRRLHDELDQQLDLEESTPKSQVS